MSPNSPRSKHVRDGRREFASVEEILERSPAMKLIREHDRLAAMRGTWERAVGDTFAGNTRVRRYASGRLYVDVFSAPLLQELAGFRKNEIMGQLKQADKFKGIVDIVFRSG